ncbi:MAG: NAD(P)H-dependent glycerol-3-phosphate dehydrogenase [Salibacteraceae bacterium]|nr:NAD(P)H-dependent glycerol-3-phosphate dehydrogenase [Salibacteraceae bacterium]|tara:strand:- start:65364 stop:66353 length:990 start_codon:yes stop_codon:yes gene_type:complete
MRTVGIIGGGSWATALAKILTENLDSFHWWMRNEASVEHFNQFHRNPNYLSSVHFLGDKINVTTDLRQVVDACDVLIIATPSAFLNDVFKDFDKTGMENKIIFSAVKGIIPEYHAIPAKFIHKQFRTPYSQIGIICGPCHAEEVALERLSYLTIACETESYAQEMAKMLACRYIKTTVSEDLFGSELSAILKNVYAVASGICHGLGYGDNFQAVLISNAIQEINRFVDAISPVHRDVQSSAYLGDLLVTAYSQYSRNRTFGSMIGRGYSVRSAQFEMNMVAEGYYAAKGIIEINKKFGVEIPICSSVYRILYERMSPTIEMKLLADKLS